MAESNGKDPTYRWGRETTEAFIKMRAENDALFTGAKYSATVGWSTVLEKMGLLGEVEPKQAKKKWDNLKKKYKERKYLGTNSKYTAATWPWFNIMDEVMGHKPLAPLVLRVCIPEDTPGPAAAVGNQEEEEKVKVGEMGEEEEAEEEEPVPGPQRKRRRDKEDELLDLLRDDMRLQREDMQQQREDLRLQREDLHQQREDMRLQREDIRQQREDIRQQREDMRQQREDMRQLREADERRERENKERMERLFSLLERIVERQ